MSWSASFTVEKKAWLDNPAMRWNAGLERAGLNFRQGLGRSHYPPLSGSSYVRTYQLADRANYRITEFGHVMEFGSTYYLPYVLNGTSKWQGWPGTLDNLLDTMKMGFISGVQSYSE